jgi:hypothetical protein
MQREQYEMQRQHAAVLGASVPLGHSRGSSTCICPDSSLTV